MRARDYSKPSQSCDCSISEQNDVISCSNSKKRKIRSEPDSNMNKNSNKDLFISDSHSEELAKQSLKFLLIQQMQQITQSTNPLINMNVQNVVRNNM